LERPSVKNAVLLRLPKVLTLCISYAIVGRLALMLAMPPGYTAAIFPSAGIAVAALLIWGNRLWPGVFLGSVLLNIWISTELAPLTLAGLEVAVSAATGAALQALTGAWLVRRFIGFPTTLSKEQDIFWFMLMAGPLACMINASFGATSLYATGTITLSNYAYSWFTWWVGDTIGVLVTAPLIFIAFAHPRQIWWGRRTAVAFPLLFILTGVILLFIWVSKWQWERTQFDLKEASSHTHEKLRASFASYIDAVASIERFFSSSSQVTREQFRTFVEYTLLTKSGVKGLSWNPVIQKNQRAEFEKTVREEGFPGFHITDRDSEGQLVTAANRDEYIVVRYIEPMKSNGKAIGFDVASNPDRRKALLQARDSGHAVATVRIALVQEGGEQAGFLLFHPVYDGAHNTDEERRRNLKGFTVGVFCVSDIIDAVLLDQTRNDVVVGIYDESAEENTHLYGPEDPAQFANALFKVTDTLEVGGRRWTVKFWPSPNYLASHRGWQAWAVLAGGLLFTSILSAFLLAMTGRAYQIENLVARRTAELSGILSTAIEAIITVGENGTVESINPAGEALFSYTAAELFGQPISMIIPEFFIKSGARMGGTKFQTIVENRRDSYAVRKGKTRVPIELAISTLLTADRILYTAIIHDLTERTKMNRMKDEFISIVSHELRTPLTSIKGALGLLAGGALVNNPEKTKSMLGISYQNSERLEILINDLLEINKIQSMEAQFQMRPIRINTLINEALHSNQGYADNHGVSYLWQPSEDGDVYANGDENKLIQVLSNLFSNAVKYSPKAAQVVISTRHNDNEIRVLISDSGPGIPFEFQNKVFEKFTQADSSDTRRVGGTGLGLAIAKSIIEKHGGHIGFDSTPGHGSTFYFDLPILRFYGSEQRKENENRRQE
jgi:PAS domain S-box-containing protein